MLVEKCAICGEVVDPEENFVYLTNICVCEMCSEKSFSIIAEKLDSILMDHNITSAYANEENNVIDVEYMEEY